MIYIIRMWEVDKEEKKLIKRNLIIICMLRWERIKISFHG